MIVLLTHDATPEVAHAIADRIRAFGLQAVPLDDAKGRAFEVLGDERGQVLTLVGQPGVREILTRRVPLTGGEPLWPHFALRVGILAVLVISSLLLLTAYVPPGLGDPATGASRVDAPLEWYLRAPDVLIGRLPSSLRGVGGAVILVLGLGILFVPWLDRKLSGAGRGAAVGTGLRVAGAAVLLFTLLSMLGVLS
jgi:hypothetical protein